MGVMLAAPLALGAASQVAGAIGGGKGGDERPAEQIAPEARQALRTGVGAATESLGALPAVSSQNVVDAYRQSQERLGAMSAPAPTLGDTSKTIEEITGAAVTANAPTAAARERAYTEEAGAYGPTAAAGQTRAGEVAQEKNLIAEMVAKLKPELEQAKYQQQLQSFAQALGLESSRQQVASEPFQLINTLRQGVTGQLLGAGAPSASTRMQSVTPAWATGLTNLGQTASQTALQYNLIDQLRSGADSDSSWRKKIAAEMTPAS